MVYATKADKNQKNFVAKIKSTSRNAYMCIVNDESSLSSEVNSRNA